MFKLGGRHIARLEIQRLASEIWMEDPVAFEQLLQDLSETIELADQGSIKFAYNSFNPRDSLGYSVENGIATIPINGHILKRSNWLLDLFGVEHAATDDLRKAVKNAASDPHVKGIILDINSPGGTLSGVQELADDIYSLAQVKPTHAYSDELAASAAYFLGSQASEFTASRSAIIGSIGAYIVIKDTSKAYQFRGVKVHVLRSGEHKGVGVEGAEITDSQLAALQESVNAAAKMFITSVARGRNTTVEKIASLADGKDYYAEDATKIGLIDGVNSKEAVIGKLVSATTPILAVAPLELSDKEKTMSDELKAKLESLEAELKATREDKAKAEAKAVEAAEQIKAFGKFQKTQIIEGAMKAGKVTASMRPAIEEFSGSVDVDAFAKFVDALPVQLNLETIGKTGTQVESVNQPSEMARVASALGLSLETLAKYENVYAITSDKKLVGRKGEVI